VPNRRINGLSPCGFMRLPECTGATAASARQHPAGHSSRHGTRQEPHASCYVLHSLHRRE
jgi:hypothetical protein